jgi:prolyl-tRNA editing enzyme YbaK/EbsC (Cys-tRNA(Pro) deacylase)
MTGAAAVLAGGLATAGPATDPVADPLTTRPEGFQRVARALAEQGHPHAPVWLSVSARTCAEAADALGVQVGQIAKSVIFRRLADDRAVLVVASGDKRVDAAKVAARVGPIGRADAAFVKQRTGFSIGGVAPVAHSQTPLVLVDRELLRFAVVWAAAGHPNGVFQSSPAQLLALAAVDQAADVAEDVTE